MLASKQFRGCAKLQLCIPFARSINSMWQVGCDIMVLKAEKMFAPCILHVVWTVCEWNTHVVFHDPNHFVTRKNQGVEPSPPPPPPRNPEPTEAERSGSSGVVTCDMVMW